MRATQDITVDLVFGVFSIIIIVFSIILFSDKAENSEIGVSISKNPPSRINFRVYGKWHNKINTFEDHGFNGTLDRVKFIDVLDKTYHLDPNSPDWKIWQQRYIEIRNSLQ